MNICVKEKMCRLMIFACILALALQVPGTAMADLVATASGTEKDIFNPLLNLLSYASYTIGGFMGIGGVMKLKAHSENPTNAPLAHGLGRCAAAAGFLALPSVMGMLNSTASSTLNGSSSFSSFQM